MTGILALGAFTAEANATAVTVSPAIPHPSQNVVIAGTGFGASEAVDIYLDTADTVLIVSSATGTFSTTINLPAGTTPGNHYATAIGRHSGDAAQIAFSVSTPWLELGYGSAHYSLNPYENTLNSSNVGTLGKLWSSKTSPVLAAPAVANGRVFTAGSAGIQAVSAATGAVLWTADTAEVFDSSPAVVNNIVYAGSASTPSLYAVNPSTGAKIWTSTLGGTTRSSPVVSNNIVYIGCNDDKVYAVNAKTGALIWSYATGGAVASSPAVSDGVVYVGSTDDNVYALDAATGALIWSYATGGAVYASPAVANGVVYIGSYDTMFYALSADDGSKIWAAATNGQIYGSAAVYNSRVVVGSEDNYVYEFNTRTGVANWSVNTGGRVDGTPSIANGVVYVGNDNGVLLELDILYGSVLGSIVSRPYIIAAPAISDGILYFNGEENRTFAYALQAGTSAVKAPDIRSLRPNLRLPVTRGTAQLDTPDRTGIDP
jgi:outer membrane protein assembly factor BamB